MVGIRVQRQVVHSQNIGCCSSYRFFRGLREQRSNSCEKTWQQHHWNDLRGKGHLVTRCYKGVLEEGTYWQSLSTTCSTFPWKNLQEPPKNPGQRHHWDANLWTIILQPISGMISHLFPLIWFLLTHLQLPSGNDLPVRWPNLKRVWVCKHLNYPLWFQIQHALIWKWVYYVLFQIRQLVTSPKEGGMPQAGWISLDSCCWLCSSPCILIYPHAATKIRADQGMFASSWHHD